MIKPLAQHGTIICLSVLIIVPLWCVFESSRVCVLILAQLTWFAAFMISLVRVLRPRPGQSAQLIKDHISAILSSTWIVQIAWLGMIVGGAGQRVPDFESPQLPFVVMLACFIAGSLLALWLHYMRLRPLQQRQHHGGCLNCGYDLTATDAEVCPECGVRKEIIATQVATSPKAD